MWHYNNHEASSEQVQVCDKAPTAPKLSYKADEFEDLYVIK